MRRAPDLGDPWSSSYRDWAWIAEENELHYGTYVKIPAGLDILLSHQPPLGTCDLATKKTEGRQVHEGSEALLDAIGDKQPRVVVCGHLHGGFGKASIGATEVYNVAVLNEAYQPTNQPTVIRL